MFSKKLIPIALLIWGSLLLVACGPAQAGQAEAEPGDEDHAGQVQNAAAMDLVPIELAAGEKLQMVATTNIIGDMVQNVAGDLIELNILMPLGSDPHTFQPAPQDIALVADADVVFANGLDYEAFLDELITNAGGDAVVVRVTNGVETREFGEGARNMTGMTTAMMRPRQSITKKLKNTKNRVTITNKLTMFTAGPIPMPG